MEYNVRDEIGLQKDADWDGKCDLQAVGRCTIIYTWDNHLGYMRYGSSINYAVFLVMTLWI